MTDWIGLYIHIPWCVKKCPYCDFNSHQKTTDLPELKYIDTLLQDLAQDIEHHPKKNIQSIFIGGGTPSLLSAQAYEKLFKGIQALIAWDEDIEITLEANPGTSEYGRFQDYLSIGINRLSIGVQSFQTSFLKRLGRIHDGNQAIQAIQKAHLAGFENINIDLMYGLPEQTPEQALFDLQIAIDCQPTHLSWYELTIEPNTVFYKRPPIQPNEATFTAIEKQGQAFLQSHHFNRYEISAYGKNTIVCQHNLNYWQFGDYYGIGAGAHSKFTIEPGKILRLAKIRMPQSYLTSRNHWTSESKIIDNPQEIMFEFMLNSCRLFAPMSLRVFEKQTGLNRALLLPYLNKAKELGFIHLADDIWQITPLGQQFNNEIIKLLL